MDQLLALDYRLFILINHLPHFAWSNAVAKFFSGIGTSGLIWFVIGCFLFLREEQRDHRFFVTVMSVGLGTIILVEAILKPLVHRVRPAYLQGTLLVAGVSGYSFPSTHASISWAMAEVLSLYDPRLRVVWYLLATCISLSRIYLGVHYPTDVIFGAVLGWAIGKGISMLIQSGRMPYRKQHIRHLSRNSKTR
jgi:undecaprenyl-diphosphatase